MKIRIAAIAIFSLLVWAPSGSAITYKKRSSVQVVKKEFRPVSGQQGLWTGQIKGEGSVALHLKIMRNGRIEATRYIGSITQHRYERPTPFHYKSSLPRGRNWSWKIVAQSL